MYRKHHTKGIVIWGRGEGNDSRRVEIFTESFGLLSARVQGSRNIHSKLRSGSQDFAMGDFSLVHGKSGWKVVSVRAEKNLFEVFRSSPPKLRISGNVLNLIRKLVSEEAKLNGEAGEAHVSLFGIVARFFEFLEKAKESEIALAECLTLVRILHTLGFMRHDPELAVPLASAEIGIKDLEMIAPKRARMVELINESLKAN